ncbi:ABC transporter ATP-binding protein [Pseudonocardia ailaonensis]|uniref:ABC transporter ATP-binding protein n=1 Tax=Pseudonocardia ailaonensis TaxID=367279 RepID=A0ABN2N415_9PSEU
MTTPVLVAENLTKRFSGLVAVDGVDLRVGRGEILALIGPNGAGKTTLFNLLAGRLRPTTGRIVLEGRDVTPLSLRERVRAGVVATFQIPRQFAEVTVEEIVGLAVHYGGGDRDVDGLCAEFGLAPQSQVGSLDLHALKMLEMCRAVAVAPSVLLLDEVASGLDHHERGSITERIRELAAAGTAIVVVEHSVDFIRSLCTRAMVLSFGTVLSEGSVADVFSDKVVADAYLGRRSS